MVLPLGQDQQKNNSTIARRNRNREYSSDRPPSYKVRWSKALSQIVPLTRSAQSGCTTAFLQGPTAVSHPPAIGRRVGRWESNYKKGLNQRHVATPPSWGAAASMGISLRRFDSSLTHMSRGEAPTAPPPRLLGLSLIHI
mgnify:CR=1 FL=1